MMPFLVYNQPINSQILTEELVNEANFEQNAFPEEFQDYKEYMKMQRRYFI
ncbi:MAG: hypothetical protein ACFE9C_07920 [Candidatus Hodarchaeota archaeon]